MACQPAGFPPSQGCLLIWLPLPLRLLAFTTHIWKGPARPVSQAISVTGMEEDPAGHWGPGAPSVPPPFPRLQRGPQLGACSRASLGAGQDRAPPSLHLVYFSGHFPHCDHRAQVGPLRRSLPTAPAAPVERRPRGAHRRAEPVRMSTA